MKERKEFDDAHLNFPLAEGLLAEVLRAMTNGASGGIAAESGGWGAVAVFENEEKRARLYFFEAPESGDLTDLASQIPTEWSLDLKAEDYFLPETTLERFLKDRAPVEVIATPNDLETRGSLIGVPGEAILALSTRLSTFQHSVARSFLRQINGIWENCVVPDWALSEAYLDELTDKFIETQSRTAYLSLPGSERVDVALTTLVNCVREISVGRAASALLGDSASA